MLSPTLVGLSVSVPVRPFQTPPSVLAPVAMIVVLVYSGEHYVIDGIFGAILAAGVWFELRRYDQWRKQRKDRAAYESSTAAEIGGSAPVASSGQ